MKRITTISLMSLTTLLMLSLPVLAQRGGGGDRGRGRGGDRGGGGSDFRARILERIDANGNGVIEPNEAQGRAGEFVSRMARDAGMQPGQPLPISRLTGSGGGANQPRGNNQGNDKRNETQEDEYPTVPRFGDEAIAGFGLSPFTLAGKIVDLEKKYDRRTVENVERTLDRYDKNKNGILDHNEWSGVQWRSDPRESDLDKDGILTKAEMAERFAKRERGEERSRDERRDRGRGGGGGEEQARRGGGGGEREGGRERGRGRGGFDPSAMLSRMDRNQDGKIGPDEVDERARGFIQSRFQIDLSKPVEIEEIRKQFQRRREASSRGEQQNKSGKAEETTQPKDSYKVDGSSRLKGRLSYRSEGRALPSQLPDWWEDRDGNADGQVTLREFAERPGDDRIREFKDYDLNDDGLITTNEAAVIEAD